MAEVKKEVMFSPIQKRKGSEEVLFQLQSVITNGKLQAGDRLPSEGELVEMLQINRASVREALGALEMLRVLDIRQGDGTYLRQDWQKTGSIEFFTVWTGLGGKLSYEALQEVLELRRCVDMFIVALASSRAEPEHLAEMEKAIQDGEQALEEGRSGRAADREFHVALARATKNGLLAHLVYGIHSIADEAFEFLADSTHLKRSLLGHQLILRCIEQREADKARNAMLDHITLAEKGIEEFHRGS